MEIIKAENKEEIRLKKQQQKIWDFRENIKWCNNVSIVGVLERYGRDNGAEEIFEEIMAVNFSKLMKYNNLQTQESQWTLRTINSK